MVFFHCCCFSSGGFCFVVFLHRCFFPSVFFFVRWLSFIVLSFFRFFVLWVFFLLRVFFFPFWWFLSCGGLSFIFSLVILDTFVFVICCLFYVQYMSSVCFSIEATRLGLRCGEAARPRPRPRPRPLPLILEEIKATKQLRKVYCVEMTSSSSRFRPRTDMTSHARYTPAIFDRTPECIPQRERNLFHGNIPFLSHAGVKCI